MARLFKEYMSQNIRCSTAGETIDEIPEGT